MVYELGETADKDAHMSLLDQSQLEKLCLDVNASEMDRLEPCFDHVLVNNQNCAIYFDFYE